MEASRPDDLRSRGFSGTILAEEALAPHTTWRIGGPAEILAIPRGLDDLVVALAWAAERGVPWRVLGNGSNLLVRDEGVRGLVLHVRKVLDEVRVDGATVTAGAGASFPALARLAASRGLAGLEFAAGIPGTAGGAVVMNAGWHAFEVGALVRSVDALDETGIVARHGQDACRFVYRASAFKGRGSVVVSADLALTPADPAEIQARMDEFAASRKANQPTDLPSCGSVYLKPEGDYAGRLIEAAGLKGRRVGDIQVSPKHANFFVNLGRGTAREVLVLADLVEVEVLRRFGVRLTREFEVW